jgi:4-diphosphocytidyl-2-C-methyl-D-erythritol kinase
MKLFSSAKLNLNLEINSEIKDGLHTLTSLLIPIDLYDEIEINEVNVASDTIVFTPNIEINGKSTIEKSLDLLREVNNFSKHFEITIIKNIPTEAGLGGGSSNAGSLINYLCKTYDLEAPTNEDIAKTIGSDVPYFIKGKAALVSGIGEKVEEQEDIGDLDILIAVPHEKISTVDAYKTFDELGDQNHFEKTKINNIDLFNNMWNPAVTIEPKIQKHRDYLEEIFSFKFFMSGTGSTLFGIGDYHELEEGLRNVDKARFRLIKITKKIDGSL